MDRILAVFIPIAFFICVTVSIYFINKYKYDAIKTLGGPIPKSKGTKISWMKIGIVVLGFALGLILTGIFKETGIIAENDNQGFFIVGIVTFCVGAALYAADRIKTQDQEIDG